MEEIKCHQANQIDSYCAYCLCNSCMDMVDKKQQKKNEYYGKVVEWLSLQVCRPCAVEIANKNKNKRS